MRSNTEFIDLAQSYFTVGGKNCQLWLNGTLKTEEPDTCPDKAFLEMATLPK